MKTLEREKPFTAKQVALFRKVVAHIEADLRRLDMGTWGRHFTSEQVKQYGIKKVPECGTQACFAGWAVVLDKPARSQIKFAEDYQFAVYAESEGQKLLGLSGSETDLLFYVGSDVSQKKQLDRVKSALNKIFKRRGMTERF